MILAVLAILVILWFLGFVNIPAFTIPHAVLSTLGSHAITLREMIIFLVVVWAIGILPSPLRQIAGILFVLWLLSLFGILAFGGVALPNLLLLAIIIGIAVSLF